MITVLVACGAGVATSTIISKRVSDLLKKNDVEFNMIQCSLNEVQSHLNTVDLIITSMPISMDLGKPVVVATSYLIGIGEDTVNQQILENVEKIK